MDKLETRSFRRNLIIAIVIATIFSTLTLWLLESWIKYPLFLFEIITIIMMFLIVNNYDIKVVLKENIKCKQISVGMIIDLTLILSSLILLIADIFQISIGLIQLILSLLCTSLLSGYALLNILGIRQYFSTLEMAVLSYIISYILTAFITLATILLHEAVRILIILGIFIGLGVISMLKHRKSKTYLTRKSFARNIDALAITLTLIFYALSFYFLYPRFALLPGTDISRHYTHSIILWRTPELYKAFNYLLSHLHESAFIAISKAPLIQVQTALVTLNLIMPLAFYAMAKVYLEIIDRRLPALSTLFYSTFSGFAWIYLAKLKLENTKDSTLSLLRIVNEKAYNGAMYLAQPFLWHVPLSTSFTILITQFVLLRKMEVNKRSFIALFALFTMSSYLTHISEATILSVFLCFYAFFFESRNIRLNEAIYASIIGFLFVSIKNIGLLYLLGEPLWPSIGLSLSIPLVLLIFTYFYRKIAIQVKLSKPLSELISESFLKIILYTIIFLYVVGLIVWITGVPSFSTRTIIEVGSIPWFIYPVILGVLSILTLASFPDLLENAKAKKWLMLFGVFLIFLFIFGRVLTIINTSLFNTGYWEKRFTSYFFLASAIMAPLSVVRIVESIKANQKKFKNTLIIVTIISIIVVYGVQSSFMVLEYWNIVLGSTYRPSEEEFEAIDFLRKVLQKDRYAYTITLTGRSYAALAFAAPPYRLTGMQVVSTAVNPEMPLLSLKARNLLHAYLYMHDRDYEVLNEYRQSYLSRHLISMVPAIFKNDEVTIYNVSSVSFPQINSTTALVVPFDSFIDPKESWLYAYDILSLGGYNYTVFYDLDPKLLTYTTVILSFDPPLNNILKRNFKEDFSGKIKWKPVSGAWQYVDGGLQAGKRDEYQDAVILSPISAQNFTASLIFKPLEGDTKVANYVSIIFDWKDEKNYKYGGLMFDGSGKVYAYISSYANGKITGYPSWPGLQTGLKWQFGNSYNLTVSVRGKNVSLYVNGTQYLSTKTTIIGGQLGVRATRFYKVLFTSFRADTSTFLQLKDIDEYLNYVESGGRLIVFNTNGYGYFAERMLTYNNSVIEANKIYGNLQSLTLPVKVIVPVLSPKTGKVEAVANYKSQCDLSAYAVREKIGSGEIIYVNLHPIIEAIENAEKKEIFYNLLGKLIQLTGVRLEPFKYIPPPLIATFKEVEMLGEIRINTSSLLFPIKVNFKKLKMIDNGGNTSLVTNITRLQLLNYDDIIIESSNLALSRGKGFYSELKFNGNVTVIFNSRPASVILAIINGKILRFNNVKMIIIENSNQITLYAREPTIMVQGLAFFKELYSSSAIYQKTRTQGQNLKVNGTLALKMYLSDVYSWASSFNGLGKFERVPPLLAYNELTSLPKAILWSIIALPIFLTLILIIYRVKGDKI